MIKKFRKQVLRKVLFQPKLKHSHILNGLHGLNPITAGIDTGGPPPIVPTLGPFNSIFSSSFGEP